MHDMTEFLDLHQRIHLDRLRSTNTIDVVPREIDEHHMLRSILDRREQRCGKNLVLYHTSVFRQY